VTFDEINFFPNVDYQPLTTISNVKFTEREIDVMSCIVNGRTSRKSIGTTLLIESTTAGVHIGNIRGKLHCSSWEHIRDFIEKSDKKLLFNHHFAQLVRKNNFNRGHIQV